MTSRGQEFYYVSFYGMNQNSLKVNKIYTTRFISTLFLLNDTVTHPVTLNRLVLIHCFAAHKIHNDVLSMFLYICVFTCNLIELGICTYLNKEVGYY